MNNKFSKTVLSLFLLSIFYSNCWAADEKISYEDFFRDLLTIKNPFQSVLPQKIVEQPVENKNTDPKKNQINPDAKTKPLQKNDKDRKTESEAGRSAVSNEKFILPQLVVSGIVWNTKKPQAIINSRVVGIDDTIEGAKIVAISQTGVDVIYKEKTVTLKP